MEAAPAGILFRIAPVEGISASNVDVRPLADRPAAPNALITEGGTEAQAGVLAPRRASAEPGPSLADRLRTVLAPPLSRLLPGVGSLLEWPSELKPYQLDGVRALIERDRLLLADDMGLGKTVQAAAAMRILFRAGTVRRALLVVPASLIDQWRRELARWAPELRIIAVRGGPLERAWKWKAEAHVDLVGYETFRSDFIPRSMSAPAGVTWDLVILDEAQKIKNRDSDVSHAVKQLRRRRSWAMTGTPLENKVDDLASILEFVDHHDDGSPVRYGPGAALIARQQELQLRRRKFDVLADLPPKQVISVVLDLPQRQLAAYRRAEQDGIVRLKERGPEVRVQHVLELITRLKQICNRDPQSGESAKFEDIRERLRVLVEEGHRALLFSQYTDDTFGVGAAAAALAEFRPLTFVGSMSGAAREAAISRFKAESEHRALILSLKAGGVGLNLQDASYVFHIDRWWNPAVERQAEDRSHRIGQQVPVTVLKYTCAGTIEERIEQVLAQKQQLFDEIVDDVSLDVASRLNQDELFGLFGLAAPSSAKRAGSAGSNGLALEARCAALLRKRGWEVVETARSHDGGIDLIATRVDEVGIEQRLLVQCKDYARPVGVEVVRELIGVLPPGRPSRGVVAAPAGVTREARSLADTRGVAIWDEAVIAGLESSADGM